MTAYSYNNGVPATNNDPSVDQPNMLINTQSINSIIATDHVGFNSTGPAGGIGGQHLQCTFNGNNVPSLPATLATLFANNQDGNGNNLPNGLSQLFLYTGAADKSQLQYSSVSPGSVLLMGGIILKWGSYTIPANAALSGITFAQPFTSNVFAIVITPTAATVPIDYQYKAINITTSGFGGTRGTGVPTTATYSYIAIGN
jgi:hypothetical protein